MKKNLDNFRRRKNGRQKLRLTITRNFVYRLRLPTFPPKTGKIFWKKPRKTPIKGQRIQAEPFFLCTSIAYTHQHLLSTMPKSYNNSRSYSRRWASHSRPYGQRKRYGTRSTQRRTLKAIATPRPTAMSRYAGKQRNYPTTDITRGPVLWADRTVAKLEYTDYTTIYAIPQTGIAREFYYRMNAPYSPRGAGAETIPGLIEYSTMYSRYRVIASSIQATFQNTAGNVCDCVVAPYVTTAAQSFGPITSTADAVKTSFGNPYAKVGYSAQYTTMPTLYNYITMEKLAGSVEPLTSENWAGTTGLGAGTAADPATQCYWYIGATTHDEVAMASTAGLQFIVKIRYWVEFYSRDFEYQ